MMKLTLNRLLLIVILGLVFIWANPQSEAAEKLSAQAAVDRTEVFAGESFTFQIQVQGHDTPDKPDISGIRDFTVQSLGGQQNNSSSITIVNGRVTQNVRRGYIFSYRLTPKKIGNLTIPSIKVSAGGQTVSTQPVQIKAARPTEAEDFKLRMELSAVKTYVGQPITLTVNWFIGKDVEGFQFSLPVLMDKRFAVTDLDTPIDPKKKDLYLRIPLGDGEVIGKKERTSLEGKEYMAVRFQKILIPQKSGTIKIPPGTVTFNALMGYKKRPRSHDLFDDFFSDSFFGRRKEAIYKKFVIPSNSPGLTVLELPEAGRPANFTGLVGEYRMTASAAPTEVSVGDPITLTIRVTGPYYLENVELPPLDRYEALSCDFKIPAEMAPGKVEGRVKTFTQTVRAKHKNVTAIPHLELPYFDAEHGRYAMARTEPIPLTVSSTRIVTAEDAEGSGVSEEAKIELETWTEGIAYNYEDLSVLEDQAQGLSVWFTSPLWVVLIGLPPLSYFILLFSVTFTRRRKADPAAKQARRAYGHLVRALKDSRKLADSPVQTNASVLEAFRQYLGSKLRLPPGVLTLSDIKDTLRERGVDGVTIEDLKCLLEECEASRYAGTAVSGDAPSIIDSALRLAKNLERSLQ
ncbi:MAG: protein BatD [Deltaproteobacteria bacterium]|nr:MAG: protein BatD [Deltaproteobacteria bacterium]